MNFNLTDSKLYKFTWPFIEGCWIGEAKYTENDIHIKRGVRLHYPKHGRSEYAADGYYNYSTSLNIDRIIISSPSDYEIALFMQCKQKNSYISAKTMRDIYITDQDFEIL